MTLDTLPILDRDVERRLGGAGPFVINLHASTAPIGLPTKGPAGNEHARLYQLQRVDDGRIRYRLRLGPFASEDEAEATLTEVRLEYPGALMVTAAADDLHAIALVRGKANYGDSPADAQAAGVVPQSVVETRRYTPPMTAAQVAAAIAPAAAVIAPAVAAPAPVVPVPAAVTVAPAPAVPVPAPKRAVASVASDIASMQALMAAIDTGSAAAKVTARRDVAPADTPAPSLESTQTLRPLTPLELGEHEAPRWFVVQLGLSDAAFDPDALPHLDIFSLYRLYTVIGMDQGRLVHALRLGFFGEEVGARAVANYLASFYDEPTVKRVSVAERDRFADQRVEARKDVGATGRHLAIEITDELVVRGRRFSR
jgi:SPOR domain